MMRGLLIVTGAVLLFVAGYAAGLATRPAENMHESRVACTPYSDPGVPCVDDEAHVNRTPTP
jgi:hypothetical protein